MPRSDELASKLQLLESKLLHGEQHGGLDRLAREKEAQVREQQQELHRQREQVRWQSGRWAMSQCAGMRSSGHCWGSVASVPCQPAPPTPPLQEAKKAQRIARLEASAQSVEQKFTSLQVMGRCARAQVPPMPQMQLPPSLPAASGAACFLCCSPNASCCRADAAQEEAEAKTKQLREAWQQYQVARQELADISAEFQQERSELVDSIRLASRVAARMLRCPAALHATAA